MSLISDALLVSASLGLAIYCIVLSRRLSRFTDLEKGVGGAVAVLSAQVDDLTRALRTARDTAQDSATALAATTTRAEDVAKRLELHVAAMHDFPAAAPAPAAQPQAAAPTDPQVKPDPSFRADPQSRPGPGDDPEPDDAPQPDQPPPAMAFSHTGSFGSNRGKVDDNPQPVPPDTPQDAPAPTLFASHRRIQPGALG